MANRIQTEFTTFGICREKSYGELDSIVANNNWQLIEPESVSDWGNEFIFERRDPFNTDRLMRQQTLTGFMARTSWEGDMTDSHMNLLVPMALLADWQADYAEYPVAAVAPDGFGLSAQNAALVPDGAIVMIGSNNDGLAEGVFLAGKSGQTYELQPLTASTTQSRKVSVGNAVSGQTAKAANVNARVRVIGISMGDATAAGSQITIGANGKSISQAGNSTDFSSDELGLVQGRGLFITVGENANTDYNPFIGFARCNGAAAGRINLEYPEGLGQSSVDVFKAGALDHERVFIFTSKWIKNVDASDSKWNQDSWRMAAKYVGLDTGDVYEEIYGSNLNNLTIRFGQQTRVKMNADFVSQVKRTRPAAEGLPSNWGNASEPVGTEAISTSVDIGRANLVSINNSGATNAEVLQLLQSVDLTLGNQIEGDYVLDQPGSIGPQIGKFAMSAAISALVASREQFSIVEDTVPGSMQIAAGTTDGWWLFDVPRLTLITDRRNFDRNRSLKLDYDIEYDPDPDLDTAMIVSRFAWLPIPKKVEND